MSRNIGKKIKEIRQSKGMTQKALADKCNMKDSAIRKYESGNITPKIETLSRIADGLGVSINQFIEVTKQNFPVIVDSIYTNEDRHFIQELTSIALNLNYIGRGRLLEQAKMLNNDARFTEKEISELVSIWGENTVSEYYESIELQKRAYKNMAGIVPEYDESEAEDIPDEIIKKIVDDWSEEE